MENYSRQQIYNNRNTAGMRANCAYPYGCNNNGGRSDNNCGCYGHSCGLNGQCLEDMPLAMAYVPWQKWEDVYEPCKAINAGTIFPELNLPFLGRSYWKR